MVPRSIVHKATTGRDGGELTVWPCPTKHYWATRDACGLRASCSHGARVTSFRATGIEVWCVFLLAPISRRSYMVGWLVFFCAEKASTRSPYSVHCVTMSGLVKIWLQWRDNLSIKVKWCHCLIEKWKKHYEQIEQCKCTAVIKHEAKNVMQLKYKL